MQSQMMRNHAHSGWVVPFLCLMQVRALSTPRVDRARRD
jgi:hypothetical protein